MDRESLFSASLLLLAATTGCDGDVILTGLDVDLPPNDVDAAGDLSTLVVEVWAGGDDVCVELERYLVEECGQPCTTPPDPRDRGAAPDASVTLTRRADGTWPPIDLAVPGDGPWEVRVVGSDGSGAPFLFGCSIVDETDGQRVVLSRSWCDTAVCSGQLHPACPVTVDCPVPGSGGSPRCVPLAPTWFAWEEGGEGCEPDGAAWSGPCRQARIRCEPGASVVQVDGVCPSTGRTSCGGTLSEDRDCDGVFPGPCGSCTPGERVTCGTGTCAAIATCAPDGTFGDCTLPSGVVERCGNGDEDCDGLDDGIDPDAIADCNAGRPDSAPAADSCTTSGCRCSDSAPCPMGFGCCNGSCVKLADSAAHCGGCFAACPGICERSTCLTGPGSDAGVCSVASCNAGQPPTAPIADNCTMGSCRCGDLPPCSGGTTCCNGACIAAGATETCDGTDEDCDGLADGADSDALDWCNRGRIPTEPAAATCEPSRGGCLCGDMPACGPGFTCCPDVGGRRCVDLTTDENHCGACGNACPGMQLCGLSACG